MARVILLIIFFFIFNGCESKNNLDGEIVKSLSFNNGKVSALLIKEDYGGATGSLKHKLVFKNKDYNSVVLIAEKVKHINIEKENNNIVILSIDSERIYNFSNFWYDRISNEMYIIIIKDKKFSQY